MTERTSNSGARVLLELGPVTRLTLNRPTQANALDWEMGLEFEAAISRISSSSEVRVVLLDGAGKHFCAGGDFAFIEENTRLARDAVHARMLRFYQMFLAVLELPVPTCALVGGSAIGAGLCLALACDIRIGCTTTRVGANFVHLGLHPGMGATALLPHVVGQRAATELLLGGAVLGAERALALGLLNQVVEPSQLADSGAALGDALAQAAPIALRETVETLRAPLRERLGPCLAREAACQAHDFGTEDVKRAIAAFRAHERPTFVGR